MAIQSDGKIVAAGTSDIYNFAVVRYNTDGTLDTSFNGTGKVTTAVNSSYSVPSGLVMQNDGKILVAGSSSNGNNNDFALVRYNSGGSLDMSFNGTGKVTTAIGNSDDNARSLVLERYGKIVVAGETKIADGSYDFAVVRYNPNGSLDTTFNGTGKATADFGAEFDYGAGVAVQDDGNIVAAGWSGYPNQQFAMARFHGGPSEIVVELPAGFPLADASGIPVGLGSALIGSNVSKLFTIRNTGTADLTDLSATLAANGNPSEFTIGPLGATTLAPGASTTFTVTFSPSAPGVRTATLLIASNDEDENPFEINLTGSQATALEVWRQEHFNSPYSIGDGADLNDSDSDGIVNLMEFATGSDPRAFTPPIGQLVKNGNTLEFTYSRPKAALADLRYDLEASATLSGTWSSAGQTAIILSEVGNIQQVKAAYPAGTGKRFVRLRVTRL